MMMSAGASQLTLTGGGGPAGAHRNTAVEWVRMTREHSTHR